MYILIIKFEFFACHRNYRTCHLGHTCHRFMSAIEDRLLVLDISSSGNKTKQIHIICVHFRNVVVT